MDERISKSPHTVVTYQHHQQQHQHQHQQHHHETRSEGGGHYVSSLVVNLRQLNSELRVQHQRDKQELNDLNRILQQFVDRVHQLQAQNLRYRTAIADCRRQSTGLSHIDVKWDEGYFGLRRDILAVESSKVDYEWDAELFYLQITIYKQLIDIEQQWDNKRIVVLEDELKQSASVLVGLRSSYGEIQRKVQSLYGECDDLFKQYMTLTHDWCIAKKHRNKGHLNMETLKSYIAFYKNLNSYAGHDFSTTTIQGGTVAVRSLDLDKIIKKIRHDFEAFYATVYREMVSSYETKMTELETDVKQTLQQQSLEFEEFSLVIQTQQTEYEKVQKSLAYEKEMYMRLESTYSKLEGELKSIQIQNEERFDLQAKELHDGQESIMFLAFDVDEIRRSKADLEAEIIVYRHLLEIYQIEARVEYVPPPLPPPPAPTEIHTAGSESLGRLAVQNQRKGSVGIKECAPNGAYISIVNYSSSKDIDISKWKIKRHIDSVTKLKYTIPDGTRLSRGTELRIYAKSASGAHIESSSIHKLINHDLVSWGMGASIETILFNKHGDEEASYLQSITF